MTQALGATQDPEKTKKLLQRLCYDSTGFIFADTSEPEALQHLGFAKMEIKGGGHFLFIKSELIKVLSLVYLVGDAPPFTTLPRVGATEEVNVPELLVACLRSFKPLVIHSAF